MKNWLVTLSVALLSMGGIVALQMPRVNYEKPLLTQAQALEEEQQKQFNLDLLRQMPTFGFRNLIANWVFLNFIQYYGDYAARELTGNSLARDYFEILVDRDPRFLPAYFFLSPATSLFGGDPEVTVRLIEKGLESIAPETPLAYQLWTYKGIDEVLFLGDLEAAQHSYTMAAEWAKLDGSETALFNGDRARETAAFLATKPDSRLIGASSWLMVFSNARDDQTRQLALTRMQELGAEITITPDSITVKMPEE